MDPNDLTFGPQLTAIKSAAEEIFGRKVTVRQLLYPPYTIEIKLVVDMARENHTEVSPGE